MKKYWKDIVLISLTILVAVPLAVAFMVSDRVLVIDTSNDWIGFWGGYLGGIFGSIATIGGVALTIKDDREKRILEEESKNAEQKERRRLEILPYLESEYVSAKTSYKPNVADVPIVHFTVVPPIVRHYSEQDLEKEIEKQLKQSQKYFLLKYKLKNIGCGSAAGLYLTIDDVKAVLNGGFSVNDEKDIFLSFAVEEFQEKRVNIELEYTDVANIGKYRQNEVLLFTCNAGHITLEKEKPMSEPMMK